MKKIIDIADIIIDNKRVFVVYDRKTVNNPNDRIIDLNSNRYFVRVEIDIHSGKVLYIDLSNKGDVKYTSDEV